MPIDSRIPLQVNTPQFSGTLASLVQRKDQREQQEIQNNRADRVANSQIQANNALAQQRTAKTTALSDEQIEAVNNRALLGYMTVRNGLQRALDPSVNDQVRAGRVRELAQEAGVVSSLLAQSGQDQFAIGRVFDTINVGLARDPQGLLETMRENIDPFFSQSGILEDSNKKREIVGLVTADGVESLLFDGEGGFYDTRNNRREIPAGATLIESASLNSANAQDLSNAAQDKLGESEISTRQYIATTGDMLSLLDQNEDINTAIAGAASLVEGFKQEATAIGRAVGIGFDEKQLDPATYDFDIDGLGTLNARTKSLITALAYTRARINDPGGRLSERDVQAAIREIGGNLSDPDAFRAVLLDVAQRADRDFRIRYSTLKGEEYAGDLGLQSLTPQQSTNVDISNMSDDEFLELLNN